MAYSLMKTARENQLEIRDRLEKLIKGRNTPQKIVLRAKTAVRVLEGMLKKHIADEMWISRTTVYLWARDSKKEGCLHC